MKKVLLFLLALTFVFTLFACGSGNSGEVSDSTSAQIPSASETSEESKTSAQETEGNKDGKTLVVYFSATGNTEEVANHIVAATGADIFKLEPVNAYTDDDLKYKDNDSRVSREHDNPEEQNIELVKTSVENWDEYDTVFIGYPIWWGTAAWPVNGFVKDNDFTGKTVIPFCTSGSSEIGESGKLLEEMAGSGNWIDGHRFSSNSSESDVISWVGELGL